MSLDKEVDKLIFPSSGRLGGPGGVPIARSGSRLGGFCGLGRNGGGRPSRSLGLGAPVFALSWPGQAFLCLLLVRQTLQSGDPLSPHSEVYVLGVHLSWGHL